MTIAPLKFYIANITFISLCCFIPLLLYEIKIVVWIVFSLILFYQRNYEKNHNNNKKVSSIYLKNLFLGLMLIMTLIFIWYVNIIIYFLLKSNNIRISTNKRIELDFLMCCFFVTHKKKKFNQYLFFIYNY